MMQFGLVEKLIVGAVGVMILAGLYFAWSEHQQDIGATSERAKEDKEYARFRVRVNKGVVNYDTCDRAGGMWDFRKSACQLSGTVGGGE